MDTVPSYTPTDKPKFSFRTIILIGVTAVVFTLLGGITGFYLGKSSSYEVSPLPEAPVTAQSASADIADIENILRIVTVTNVVSKNPFVAEVKKVGVRSTAAGQELFIADKGLENIKHLHEVGGAMEFLEIFDISDYIVVPYSGADDADLVIARKNGDVVTTSLWKLNEEYRGWAFNEVTPMIGDSASLDLFRIDGSEAYLEFDLATGKVIEVSFKQIK